MQVDVVSAERLLFSGEANAVYARSLDGQIGILPGHQPALLALDTAPLRVEMTDGEALTFAVHSGFLEFRENHLTVLADDAEPVEEIDVGRAEARLRELEAERGVRDEQARRAEVAKNRLRVDMGRS